MENTPLPAASDYEYLPAITLHTSAQELKLHTADTMVTTSRNKRSGGGFTTTKRVRDLDFPRESRRRSFDHMVTSCNGSAAEAVRELVDGRRRASVPSQLGCVQLTPHKQGKNFVSCQSVGKLCLNEELYNFILIGSSGVFSGNLNLSYCCVIQLWFQKRVYQSSKLTLLYNSWRHVKGGKMVLRSTTFSIHCRAFLPSYYSAQVQFNHGDAELINKAS